MGSVAVGWALVYYWMMNWINAPTSDCENGMITDNNELATFLIEAKRNTYASQQGRIASSREASKDLEYRKDDYRYLDSYFGEQDFSGQEVVYHSGKPIWSMNYYGKMTTEAVPEGFIETLREALLRVGPDQPYRGCDNFRSGKFTYHCQSHGTISSFSGEEIIRHKDQEVYRLVFHGGQIR